MERMHQVLRRYWAGKTDVVRLEADAAHQKKLFFLLMKQLVIQMPIFLQKEDIAARVFPGGDKFSAP